MFFEEYIDLENAELKKKLETLAKHHGYTKGIKVVKANNADLHSNAQVQGNAIILTETLLDHHKDNDEEIVAIIAHELAHWKENHIYKLILQDSVYMIIWGYALSYVVNSQTMFE